MNTRRARQHGGAMPVPPSGPLVAGRRCRWRGLLSAPLSHTGAAVTHNIPSRFREVLKDLRQSRVIDCCL